MILFSLSKWKRWKENTLFEKVLRYFLPTISKLPPQPFCLYSMFVLLCRANLWDSACLVIISQSETLSAPRLTNQRRLSAHFLRPLKLMFLWPLQASRTRWRTAQSQTKLIRHSWFLANPDLTEAWLKCSRWMFSTPEPEPGRVFWTWPANYQTSKWRGCSLRRHSHWRSTPPTCGERVRGWGWWPAPTSPRPWWPAPRTSIRSGWADPA